MNIGRGRGVGRGLNKRQRDLGSTIKQRAMDV